MMLETAQISAFKPVLFSDSRRKASVTAKVPMPDGSLLYQPLVRRPQLRNAITTADEILREIADLVAKGKTVTITELRIGDAPKPAQALSFRRVSSEPDSRPCDSERSD